ncbi:transketolase [Rhodovibrio sodomensis]|uniref:Transketolase n=1 Tax=Rhodovibrio sodomensis TaxID=1088 RepID=A0ABS1DGH6_9PROT|nr:transketolase [Rhodovibrio sodomensis]MBK1669582.1 transketolase [Rhodovibrio sodomensis]
MSRDVRNVDKSILAEKAKMIRRDVVEQTDVCGSGHYGSAFSIAEILAVLYYQLMHVRPDAPTWEDRDRFTMGKGHAAIALYPVLADLGFFDRSWLDNYTRLNSPLGDHPDMRKVPGADFSSGSIGHNLSVSVGMALGAKRNGSPARAICLMGDGEMTEGQVWEAAVSAPNFGLDNLVGIVDINKAGSDGYTADIMDTRPLADKWQAFGWRVIPLADGHDLDQVSNALNDALNRPDGRPTVVLADTVAGKGVSFMEGYWQWHLGFLGPKDKERALAEIEKGLN